MQFVRKLFSKKEKIYAADPEATAIVAAADADQAAAEQEEARGQPSVAEEPAAVPEPTVAVARGRQSFASMDADQPADPDDTRNASMMTSAESRSSSKERQGSKQTIGSRQPQRRSRTKEKQVQIIEEDEDQLTEEDFQELDDLVKKLNPAFQFPHTLRPDKVLEDMVNARKSKLTKFNSDLICGHKGKLWEDAGIVGPQVVPHMVVVTGHKGAGGNVGVNGLYMRFADDYEGNPVYQKQLEKRARQDVAAEREEKRIAKEDQQLQEYMYGGLSLQVSEDGSRLPTKTSEKEKWYERLVGEIDTAYEGKGPMKEFKARKAKEVVQTYAQRFETVRGSSVKALRRCDNGHPLQYKVPGSKVRGSKAKTCDACGQQGIRPSEPIYRCDACDYGVCEHCANSVSVDKRRMMMVPSKGGYFLYYQARMGSWVISAAVASQNVFARCNGFGEGVPTMLNGWEVFNIGSREFRPSVGMKCYKCGTAQAETEAPLAGWLPPVNCPRPRLENDSW